MKLSHTQNKEWGSKARKEQEALRGLTHTDAHRAIAEELATIAEARAAEVEAAEQEAAFWAEYEAEQLARRLDEELASYLTDVHEDWHAQFDVEMLDDLSDF